MPHNGAPLTFKSIGRPALPNHSQLQQIKIVTLTLIILITSCNKGKVKQETDLETELSKITNQKNFIIIEINQNSLVTATDRSMHRTCREHDLPCRFDDPEEQELKLVSESKNENDYQIRGLVLQKISFKIWMPESAKFTFSENIFIINEKIKSIDTFRPFKTFHESILFNSNTKNENVKKEIEARQLLDKDNHKLFSVPINIAHKNKKIITIQSEQIDKVYMKNKIKNNSPSDQSEDKIRKVRPMHALLLNPDGSLLIRKGAYISFHKEEQELVVLPPGSCQRWQPQEGIAALQERLRALPILEGEERTLTDQRPYLYLLPHLEAAWGPVEDLLLVMQEQGARPRLLFPRASAYDCEQRSL